MEKTCSTCGVTKPIDQFSKHKTCAGGYNTICKRCMVDRANLWRENNKEKARANRSARWIAYRDAHGILPKRRYTKEERAERDRQSGIRSYARNRDKHLARSRKYYSRPGIAEKHKITMCNYRAKKFGATDAITIDDWNSICAAADNKCLACGAANELTIDHVLPLSMGGPNVKENIQPLCRQCNSSKNRKHIDYRQQPASA